MGLHAVELFINNYYGSFLLPVSVFITAGLGRRMARQYSKFRRIRAMHD